MLLAVVGCSSQGVVEPGPKPEPPPLEPPTMPWVCDAGSIPDATGGCVPAGVRDCGEGFAAVEGGCEAILPEEACGPGTMAIPGDTTCQPVAPCPTGTWGDIPTDANTVFVDSSFVGAGDGSQAEPFATIGEALAVASAGATVAVAAGSYGEAVVVDVAVELRGVCPDLVEIAGPLGIDGAVFLNAAGASLRGFSITGGGDGVAVFEDATLSELHIHDTEHIGLGNFGASEVVAHRILVEHASVIGVATAGGQLTLTESAVRDVPDEGPFTGFGTAAVRNPSQNVDSVLILERSHIERVIGAGVYLQASIAFVRDTVIRDIGPDQVALGNGVRVYTPSSDSLLSYAELDGVQIVRGTGQALGVQDAGLVARNLTIADTQEGAEGQGTGMSVISTSLDPARRASASVVGGRISGGSLQGVGVLGSLFYGESLRIRDVNGRSFSAVDVVPPVEEAPPSEVTLWGCDFANNSHFGVFIDNSHLLLEASRIAAVEETPELAIEFGTGIHLMLLQSDPTSAPPEWTVRDSLFEDGHGFSSIVAIGGQTQLERVWVRNFGPRQETGLFGRGITLQAVPMGPRGAMVVDQSRIERVHDAGVVAGGSDMTLQNSFVLETQSYDGHDGDGVLALVSAASAQLERANITINNSEVRGSARVGVGTFGGDVQLVDTRLECNAIPLNRESSSHGGDIGTITNGGGNVCTCDGVDEECKAISSNLSPPPSVGSVPDPE
jgi:Protein of unknown function (DUF1565)